MFVPDSPNVAGGERGMVIKMKNYRYLVPLAMAGLMGLSWYQVIGNAQGQKNQYQEAINQARNYAEQGIITDAAANYKTALSIKKSVKLYQEISALYQEQGSMSDRIDWDQQFISVYPENAAAYEPLLRDYCESEEYASVFDLYDTIKKRTESSKVIEEMMKPIEYYYYSVGDSYENALSFCAGYCPVQREGKWGYINQSGTLSIGTTYTYAAPFCGELAGIITEEGESYFIDQENNKKMLMPEGVKVQGVSGLFSGLFAVYDGQNYKYYNEERKEVFGSYDYAGVFSYERALVKEGETWKLIDINGNAVSEKQYEDAFVDENGITFQNERGFVKTSNGWKMIDTQGSEIGGDSYDDVMSFVQSDSYAAVKTGGKWGFIDKEGKMVIEPQYEEARSFSNGFAAVKEGGKWGFINTDNNMVISPEFDETKDFNSLKNVMVKKESLWYMISLYKYNH